MKDIKYILITVVTFIICITSVGAYEIDISKKDTAGNIVKNKLVVPAEKDIIVTGYGKTREQALNNALKSSVEQYIGVVVDSETIIINDQLIKDQVLTSTHGYVKKYDEISTSSKDGLVEVKIKATVASQKILKKIQSLNIATISIDYDTEDIYTRTTTKAKSKKDSEVLLKKYIGNFCNINCIQNMLTIKPLSVKVLEDEIKNGLVPVVVSFNTGINYKAYEDRIKILERNLKNTGGVLYSRYDIPKLKKNKLLVVNKDRVVKIVDTDIGIIKKYGSGYKLDVWKFPKKWSDIYPFNSINKSVHWTKLFNIIIEFKNKESSVIKSFNISEGVYMAGIVDCIFNVRFLYDAQYICNDGTGVKQQIISPFIMKHHKSYTSEAIDAKFTLTLDELRSFKTVNIELEQK